MQEARVIIATAQKGPDAHFTASDRHAQGGLTPGVGTKRTARSLVRSGAIMPLFR